MCFIFFKQFQLYLRKLLKVVFSGSFFVCFGFFFKREKKAALAKLTLVAEERFPFFIQLFVIKLLMSYIFIIKGEENSGFLNHFDLN